MTREHDRVHNIKTRLPRVPGAPSVVVSGGFGSVGHFPAAFAFSFAFAFAFARALGGILAHGVGSPVAPRRVEGGVERGPGRRARARRGDLGELLGVLFDGRGALLETLRLLDFGTSGLRRRLRRKGLRERDHHLGEMFAVALAHLLAARPFARDSRVVFPRRARLLLLVVVRVVVPRERGDAVGGFRPSSRSDILERVLDEAPAPVVLDVRRAPVEHGPHDPRAVPDVEQQAAVVRSAVPTHVLRIRQARLRALRRSEAAGPRHRADAAYARRQHRDVERERAELVADGAPELGAERLAHVDVHELHPKRAALRRGVGTRRRGGTDFLALRGIRPMRRRRASILARSLSFQGYASASSLLRMRWKYTPPRHSPVATEHTTRLHSGLFERRSSIVALGVRIWVAPGPQFFASTATSAAASGTSPRRIAYPTRRRNKAPTPKGAADPLAPGPARANAPAGASTSPSEAATRIAS